MDGPSHPRPRLCARNSCQEPATATLTVHYAARTAWIDDLADEPEPAGHDLCAAHANRLGVPLGWEREDRRMPALRPFPARIAV